MSRDRPLRSLALVLSTLVANFSLHPLPGHATAAAACPAGTVCDPALGIAIRPQPGWLRLLPPKVPPHVISLVTRPGGGSCCADYNDRLHIGAWDLTHDRNAARAANAGANRLIDGFRARLTMTRTPVRYGGSPGVLIRGLPPTPAPALSIVLAHAGAVYLIIAPGIRLAPDQQAALASLHFIPRQGVFPLANPPVPAGPRTRRRIPTLLRVIPNPVALRQARTVSLLGVQAGRWYRFVLTPRSGTGVARRFMGQFRASVAGVVQFRSPPFTAFPDVGQWSVTARSHTGQQFPSATVTVAGLLLEPHSARARPGRAYPFRLYTHCGANFSVDFDHSFWDLTDRTWADRPAGTGPHEGLGDPFQPGTMTLVDATHARFDFVPLDPNTGLPGRTEQIHFTRHTGPKILLGYCS